MSQNTQAIKALTTKLCWLLGEVDTLSEASPFGTLPLRDNMIMYFIGIFTHVNITDAVSRQLKHTCNELEKLKTLCKVRYTAVSQIVSQCEKDILFYLASYSVRPALAYSTYIMCSQCTFTGSNTHGRELDECKGALCIGGSEAHRCDWTPIFHLHRLRRFTESKHSSWCQCVIHECNQSVNIFV